MDLHDKPFDDTTVTKLKLFEDYAQAWIPTFLKLPYITEIHIFDFFAGTGYDLKGIPGSPIRLIEKIIEQRGNIFQSKITIKLHLNEFDRGKYESLISSCTDRLQKEIGIELYVKLEFYNEDFSLLFPRLFPIIKQYPSLVYLDQNGIKFLSEHYLKQLESTKQTDFLYFASSSYILRFGELPEFKTHLPHINIEQLKRSSYNKVHRNLTEQLRNNISPNSDLKLFPFSLRKNKNIYGVIFGASHYRAVDKFLDLTWKYNGKNGDANFDIDDEANIGQLDMFQGPRLTKIESFQQQVRDKILSQQIKTNHELLNFVYENGHIGKHADECLRELKRTKIITYASNSPCVTYESVFKNKKSFIMKKSKIEWTEETWNPTTGCNKVSAGCKNCYAEVMANRLKAMGASGYENGFEFTIMPDRLEQPLRKKKSTKYFVNSMSDLFHEEMPHEFLDKIMEVIELTPQHIYQILTKREDAMFEYFSKRAVPQNIWLGVSVENKKNGVPRIDKLRNINATIKFLSVEPLLEDIGKVDLTGIDWVIVGGESGTNARPMKQEWALNVKGQCEEQNVAFFFKQWGTWGADGVRRSKKSNGRILEGQEWNEYPESLAG